MKNSCDAAAVVGCAQTKPELKTWPHILQCYTLLLGYQPGHLACKKILHSSKDVVSKETKPKQGLRVEALNSGNNKLSQTNVKKP